MDFDVRVAHSITEIPAAIWDSSETGHAFASHRWYRFGERALSDCSPSYIVLSTGGEPVARAALWLKRQEWLPIASPALRLVLTRLLERSPLLMCAAPLTSMPGLVLPASPLRADALRAIAETALELGRDAHASFALFSYMQEQDVRTAGWPAAYSVVSFSDPETRLDIAWSDFDGFLRHLAKSTRRNHKLHCQRADEMGVTITAQPKVPEIERAVALIREVEKYHHMGPRPWTRAVLENGDLVDFTWISARIGDRLVGGCALLGDGDAWIATLLALDYTIPDWIHVYYQVMYAAVRCAIERGARILYGGGGAYEFKRRLGFRMLPDDYLMVAALKQPFRPILRGLARWMGSKKPEARSSSDTDLADPPPADPKP